MRTTTVLVAAALTTMLAACGDATGPDPVDAATSSVPDVSPTTATIDPGAELAAMGIVMQRSADAQRELCVGGVLESYPPQCAGPVLAGEFSWDDVTAEEASGVTWTNNGYYAVGYLDLSGGGQGTLTLTRPLSQDPPEGYPTAAPDTDMFPQLCDDPTADIPDVDQDARTAGADGFDEEQAMNEVARALPGYVIHYVSDGGPTMNVVLNSDGDLDAARAQIREVFTGPLCLAQRDLPSEADVRAAQDALSSRFEELNLLSSGSGVSGLLEVGVLVADQATVDAVHEAVSQWLTPEQVQIVSTFQELTP